MSEIEEWRRIANVEGLIPSPQTDIEHAEFAYCNGEIDAAAMMFCYRKAGNLDRAEAFVNRCLADA